MTSSDYELQGQVEQLMQHQTGEGQKRPDARCSRCHHGANCCQKAPHQKRSSSPHAQRLQRGIGGPSENRIISLSKALCVSGIYVGSDRWICAGLCLGSRRPTYPGAMQTISGGP